MSGALIGPTRIANVNHVADTTLAAGNIVATRYRILSTIGDGGFGRVFRAQHTVTGREVALKTITLPGGPARDAAEKRFVREARLAARVDHPHVVDVLDAGVDEERGVPFLAMELLVGEDLAQWLCGRDPLPLADTLVILWQTAQALDAAHDAGIVHRDLKPSNLFISDHDDRLHVTVVDFGIARQLDTRTDEETVNAGTPIYMAPEQFLDVQPTPATDIHALAMIAFRLRTGYHYFELEQSESANNFALGALLMGGARESAASRAARYGASIEDELDVWFTDLTAVDPSDRPLPATAAVCALADAAGIALADLSHRPPPPRSEEPTEGPNAGTQSLPSPRASSPSLSTTAVHTKNTGSSTRWRLGAAVGAAVAIMVIGVVASTGDADAGSHRAGTTQRASLVHSGAAPTPSPRPTVERPERATTRPARPSTPAALPTPSLPTHERKPSPDELWTRE